MNFSVYFCLIAAAVLVVFAQQSEAGAIFDKITNYIESGLDSIENRLNPGIKRSRDTIAFIKKRVQENINANIFVDPSIKLIEGFTNATQILSSSRVQILDAVLAAEKIVGKNPEGAKKLTQQSWVDSKLTAYNAGTAFFKAIGQVLDLSNDGARQGLLSASKYYQIGALALLDIMEAAESSFNDGSKAGGSAAVVSLNAYRSAIETAYAGVFYSLQKSTNESLQALRDAQSRPMQVQIENVNCGVTTKNDPEGSDALKDINEVAKNVLRNGANPALVQELEEIIKCALDSLVQITVDAKKLLANTKAIAGINTFEATTMYSKETEALKKRINQLDAKLYLGIGYVFAKSGNQSEKEIQSGFSVLEKGNVKILNTIKFSEQIVVNGLRNGGDSPMLAIETAAKFGNSGKLALIQSIIECARIVFNLL